jgi:hypothetical protein
MAGQPKPADATAISNRMTVAMLKPPSQGLVCAPSLRAVDLTPTRASSSLS